MKKVLFCLVGFGLFSFAQAQTGYLQESLADHAVEAPSSNIDLLKRSLGNSDIAASASAVPVEKPKAQAVAPASVPATPVPVTEASPKPVTQPGNTAVKPVSAPVSAVAEKAKKPTAPKTAPKPVKKTAPKTTKKATKQTSKKPVKKAVKKTPIEKELEANNALSEGERIGTPNNPASATEKKAPTAAEEAAQAELDYAARMLQESKKESQQGRFIPQPASKTAHAAVPVPNKPFNPNDFRPGVEWVKTNSTHFIIYTQKREGGIGSSNMSMAFESAYATLRRNIPWMMSQKVRVFVYQDHGSYLKYEPNAKAWTRALAYPTRGEIVVYDEPGKQQELKEVFTHELVHIFTQKFFDKHKTNRLVTPAWLDEGLAVYMEDQAYNGMKGGPWAQDLKTLNIQRSKSSPTEEFGSSRAKTFQPAARRGKPLVLMPFGQFMQEGSLAALESRGKTQDWYFQAYAMVRFLLNPAGASSPSNRMQFEQFTRLLAQGEQVRDPATGFVMRDEKGNPVYQPYSVEKALGKAYRYNSAANFEDAFWRWAKTR